MDSKVDRMVDKYEEKLRSGRSPRHPGVSVEQQVERFRIAHEHQAELQKETRLVLCELGIWSMYFPYYYAFAQQVDKGLRRGMTDYRLAHETRALVELWVARGLDREAMKDILTQVLNVDVKLMYAGDPVPGAGQQPPTA